MHHIIMMLPSLLLLLLLLLLMVALCSVPSCWGFVAYHQPLSSSRMLQRRRLSSAPFLRRQGFASSKTTTLWVSSSSSSSMITMDHNNGTTATLSPPPPSPLSSSSKHNTHRKDRFQRMAPQDATSQQECIITIDGCQYNLTAWAKAHPGGDNVLHKFHGRDATKAFYAAAHSSRAHAMLQQFAVTSSNNHEENDDNDDRATRSSLQADFPDASLGRTKGMPTTTAATTTSSSAYIKRRRWRQKLFTREDPIGVHKYLGIFCLAHFIFRYAQMLFGDPAAGYGMRLVQGRGGPHVGPVLCLIPHGLLSLSSLIFHTVPRERVVGQPMIWKEYRIHNIGFGLRSVICAMLAWTSVWHGHAASWRRFAVVGSCVVSLMAQIVADVATHRLRANTNESTTATMPYWDGCSAATQKRFKVFYAYSQFMATLACIATANPAWCLAVLLAIQMASLLMTLVRKGLLSPKGYHIGYTISLLLPYAVGFRGLSVVGLFKFPVMMLGGAALFQLRRFGINKYMLWLPIYAARILWGDAYDAFIPHNIW